jgi:hypothetical protein
VGEFVCLTSLFTTLKYYPSSDALFRERLLRYARTIPRPEGSRVLFEYVSIRKDGGRFHDVPVALFSVDPDRSEVECTTLDESLSVMSRARSSPIHEARSPGSYAPAAGR